TDELQIGDSKSEKSHNYVSPDASPPEEITSRYELGPDHLDKIEIYPADTDKGRHTTGTSEFTLAIKPQNLGVMLRRKLDYAFPNQRAEVFIADASAPTDPGKLEWKPAGIWYLADRKSTRLNSSHLVISYAVFCLKKKKKKIAEQH